MSVRSDKTKRHRMLSYHTSNNSFCRSVVDKLATMNLTYECIIAVLTSRITILYVDVMDILLLVRRE